MPFFKLDKMSTSLVAPGHSTAQGPTITGKELVLSGRLQMRIDNEVREMGPGEAALILGDQEHEQQALEDGTRFISFKTAVGSQPVGE